MCLVRMLSAYNKYSSILEFLRESDKLLARGVG